MKRSILCFFCFALFAAGCGRAQTPSAPLPSTSSALTSPSQAAVSPSPSPTFQGKVVKLRYLGGVVSPKLRDVEVKLGEKVRIELESDRGEELHVHAYDQKVGVVAGQTAVLEFTADIPGSFEVELEKGNVDVFQLKVQ